MSTDLHCPNCGAEMDLATALASAEDGRALARLVALSVPLGARVLRYVQLFCPLRQRLTAAKKIKLIVQLLPDLERRAIQYKGRDWAAPLDAWAQAIDQMTDARDAGRLELPMKGHGYLYAVLAGMADKHEAAAEQERDKVARARAHSSAAPTSVQQALGAGIQPMDFHRGEGAAPTRDAITVGGQPSGRLPPPQPPGTSPAVRRMKEEIARKKESQQ